MMLRQQSSSNLSKLSSKDGSQDMQSQPNPTITGVPGHLGRVLTLTTLGRALILLQLEEISKSASSLLL